MSGEGDKSEENNTDGHDLEQEAGKQSMATSAVISAASCLPDVDWAKVMGRHLVRAVTRAIPGASSDMIPENFLLLAEKVKAHPLHAAATCHDISSAALSQLLSKPDPAFDCDVVDIHGTSALHWASYGGRTDWVRGLLEAGATVDLVDYRGHSALFMATLAGHVDIVRLLCAAGANTELEDIRSGEVALHIAVLWNHLEVGRVLIHEGGADKDRRSAGPRHTPLHLAAYDGRTNFVRMLCAAGANTEVRDGGSGYLPLHAAVSQGHLETTVALIELGADPEARSLMQLTPLMVAALLGIEDIVQALLRGGAHASTPGIGNLTPLHFAAERGYERVCRILLKAGANVSARVDKPPPRSTPLHVACRNTRLSCVLTLLEAGADETLGGETPARWGRGGGSAAAAEKGHAGPPLLPTKPIDVIGLGRFRPDDNAELPGQSESAEDHARRRNPETINLIHQALKRAPANRAWRRRSWLIMVKARHAATAVSMSDAAAVAVATHQSSEGQQVVEKEEGGGDHDCGDVAPAATTTEPLEGVEDKPLSREVCDADQECSGTSDASTASGNVVETAAPGQHGRQSATLPPPGESSDEEASAIASGDHTGEVLEQGKNGEVEVAGGAGAGEQTSVVDAVHHKRARQDPPAAEGMAALSLAGAARGDYEEGESAVAGPQSCSVAVEEVETVDDVKHADDETTGADVCGDVVADVELQEVCGRLFALSEVVEGAFRRVVSFL